LKILKGVKELLVDGQFKISIIELGDEVLVSADVPALEWCYDVSGELAIDNAKVVYAFIQVPEVGTVEVVGSKVINNLKAINIKYKVKDAGTVLQTYHKVIKYMDDLCRALNKVQTS